jgi:Hg(II)-responsive transcriptional regulator
MKPLTIGQIARRADVGVETVRFYERQGLLEQPDRRSSGYRQYTEDAVRRLQFIKRAKAVGFTLREIADLIALRLDPTTTRAEVRKQAEGKLAAIDRKIDDLRRMRAALFRLVEACDGHGSLAGCPILDALDGTAHELNARAR